MEEFNNLDLLYQHLEDKALDYEFPHQISYLFNDLLKSKKEDKFDKAKCEFNFFNFDIEKGKVLPSFTSTNDEGEIIEYPNFNKFDDRIYKYLTERLNNTSNPLLKARYSNILWCSPKKHTQYAEVAIDSYLKLIKIYEEKDKLNLQDNFGLNVLETIENAYYLSCQINYKTDDIKLKLKRLINEFNFNSSSSFVLRLKLIELMLDEKKMFAKKDFINSENICWKLHDYLIKKGNINGAINMLELGEKVDNKLKNVTYLWRKRIAESYEILMNNTDGLSAVNFCLLALDNYKKIKNLNKIKELDEKYSKLKNSTGLKEISIEIDLAETIKNHKELTEILCQGNSENIIKFLIFSKNILPRYEDVQKISIVDQLFPIEILDKLGHPAQYFHDDEEKKYYKILEYYRYSLEINKINLINEIFTTTIRKHKLSLDIILKYLKEHSWFGEYIPRELPNNKVIKYNWLNLLAPALHEYFIQMHYYFIYAIDNPNFVLCIDSLTLKIEGLLRDMCRFSNIDTHIHTKDNKSRTVVREKDIYRLLKELSEKEVFDKSDTLFFNFLLTEKAGYNLRHRVAHSLMSFQEYNINYIHLLILALLRLGKYDFVKKEK